MIYLLLAGVSAYLGLSVSLGPATLLRPLLDSVSPLTMPSIAILCTLATLAASLVGAFFALREPLSLHQDELIFLAAGAALGGVVGEIASARFMAMLSETSALLLQNALLFTLVALPAVYFSFLSYTVRPLAITRMASAPVAFIVGVLASFLSFGAEPLTLALYFLLFDAEGDEAALAALTVSLFAMTGKFLTYLIRSRFALPDAGVLLWLLPGAILGAVLAMIPTPASGRQRTGKTLLNMSLFTALINVAAAIAY